MLAPLADRVNAIITRYSMFNPGHRVGVAVSGGADSVCLLHVLGELAPRWPLQLCVLHLNHKLRGAESDEDARFVEDLALGLGLDAYVAEANLSGDGNLEQAARDARREFFVETMRTRGLDRVATGHTRSDQAETVLFRFLRGSGTAGLAGILPVTGEGLVRPLLEVDRADVEQYLRERGIRWREDSTNRSKTFARNRIRHELLPLLARDWNPALPSTMAHTADWALAEEAYWKPEIDRLAAARLDWRPPALHLRCDALGDLPLAVARRLLRRAFETVKGDLRGIDFEHIRAVLLLASSHEGHGRLQIPGIDVFRSFEWLRLGPPGMDGLAGRNFRLPLPIPCCIALPRQRSDLQLEVIENPAGTGRADSRYNEEVSCLDWERISGPLELRNWRPGDQYKAIGHSGQEKIKTLFHEARIPLWERRNWPVITEGDEIVWARRFGPALDRAATPETRVVLEIRLTQSQES